MAPRLLSARLDACPGTQVPGSNELRWAASLFLLSLPPPPLAGKSPESPRPFLSAEDICQEREGVRADVSVAGSTSGAVESACPMQWAMGPAPGTAGHRAPRRAAGLARLELPTPSGASPCGAAHGTSLRAHG